MCKIAEYEALRATIRERGTARMCLILAGLIAWGALTLALNASEFERAVTLVPFLVLAATFEISFFIHTGVERIGRYLQVFYENEGPAPSERPSTSSGRPEPVESRSESRGWENTVMAYGRNNPGGLDPLFVTLFACVAAVNFVACFPSAARHPGWVGISLAAHLIFGWRLVTARRRSANQRAVDLDRFRALKDLPPSN
jgi:hypothetical protein